MSGFNFSEERKIRWNFSLDEIEKRWELWLEWDMVHRIAKMFGGEEESEKPKYSNEKSDMHKVMQLLNAGGMNAKSS